jgi:hypothetical protein
LVPETHCYGKDIAVSQSFLFVITPDVNLSEEALDQFEAAVRRELEAIQVLQRNVKGQTNDFYRGSGADGKPQVLWLMRLDLVSPDSGTGGSAIPEAVNQARAALKGRATISATFKLSDLSL